MALPILDGNQSATTLSTILSSGQHITAHTVVSLGTQAITDIVNATSAGLTNTQLRASAVTVGGTVTVGNSVTIASLPAISGTVTANIFGKDYDGTAVALPILTHESNVATRGIPIGFNDNGNGTFFIVSDFTPLPVAPALYDGEPASIQLGQDGDVASPNIVVPIGFAGDGEFKRVAFNSGLPISGTVTVGNTVTIAGTVTANPTGTQTIAGSVTLGAGTAQIGSVTASISNFPATQAISIASVTIGSLPAISGTVTVGNSVTISSLPALVAGTAQIGSVTASISNSVTIGSLPAISGTVTANTFALQGTAVTTSDFTSTTASTLLAGFNAGREVLTIFNEGAGNLHICAGATCTTIAYQVRLSSGDYYEVPNHQTTITHSAVFATAGTARVTEVS